MDGNGLKSLRHSNGGLCLIQGEIKRYLPATFELEATMNVYRSEILSFARFQPLMDIGVPIIPLHVFLHVQGTFSNKYMRLQIFLFIGNTPGGEA
jgi:hypothetical protein